MDCTVCQNPMIALELDDVEVDFCLSCGGIWLDGGELELLLGSGPKAAELLRSFRPASQIAEAMRQCPICDGMMEKVNAGPEEKPILIDRCVKGDGIWFDRGELQDVLNLGSFDDDGKVRDLLGSLFGSDEDKPSAAGESGD